MYGRMFSKLRFLFHLKEHHSRDKKSTILVLKGQAIRMYKENFYYSALLYKLNYDYLKGVLHPRASFLKTLCIFSKNKATSDKVSYGSGQKCSKELKKSQFLLQ